MPRTRRGEGGRGSSVYVVISGASHEAGWAASSTAKRARATAPARVGGEADDDGRAVVVMTAPAPGGRREAADGPPPLTGEAPVGSLRSRTCDNSATVSG